MICLYSKIAEFLKISNVWDQPAQEFYDASKLMAFIADWSSSDRTNEGRWHSAVEKSIIHNVVLGSPPNISKDDYITAVKDWVSGSDGWFADDVNWLLNFVGESLTEDESKEIES